MAAAKKTKAAETEPKASKAKTTKPKAAKAKAPEAKPKPVKATLTKEEPIAARAKPGPARPRGDALERGDLFFFYRPDVDDEAPGGIVDVRRFHLVLRPEAGDLVRVITVGRKTLPGSGPDGGNHWAFVDRVFRDPEQLKEALGATTYETETQGERHLPEARPAGEGVYALVRHGRDTVLAYALELPERPGEVQAAFGIEAQGRFVVSIKNPEIESPPGLGLDAGQRAELPDELLERFGARKWHPADPPAFLDHQGVELILIGGRVAPDDELGIELEPQPEDEANAEVFRDLHLDRSERTLRPLFEGKWA